MLDRNKLFAGRRLRAAMPLALVFAALPACDDDDGNDNDAAIDAQIDQGERLGDEVSSRISSELQGATGEVEVETTAAIGAALDEGEILHAEIALERSDDAEVREFAQMMIDHHSEHLAQAQAMLAARELSPLETEISEDLQAEASDAADELEAASDASFDRAYMNMQLMMHAQARVIIDHCSEVVSDGLVSDFWDDTEDIIEEHLEAAVDVTDDLLDRQ